MNSYQLLLLTLCLSCAFSTFTNTTDFWKETLGGDIHYQCYTGKLVPS